MVASQSCDILGPLAPSNIRQPSQDAHSNFNSGIHVNTFLNAGNQQRSGDVLLNELMLTIWCVVKARAGTRGGMQSM